MYSSVGSGSFSYHPSLPLTFIIQQACVRGSVECASLLLQNGAGVSVLDSHGRPPVVYALLGGFDE